MIVYKATTHGTSTALHPSAASRAVNVEARPIGPGQGSLGDFARRELVDRIAAEQELPLRIAGPLENLNQGAASSRFILISANSLLSILVDASSSTKLYFELLINDEP
jgi:hypothetical protein